jgi:AcrR family transcriptional regulator
LADRIDYSPGALYKYFGSKDEIIDAVRRDCFDRLNAFIGARIASARSAADMLLEGGMAYITFAAQNPVDYVLMFGLGPSPSTTGDQRQDAMKALLQIIEYGVESGEIKPSTDYDQRTITYHCWATVHGIASLQTTILREDNREEMLAMSRSVLRKVIDGFTN